MRIFHWKISLIGPSDTHYKGGVFVLRADFPENYPIGKPEVKFIKGINHPDVSPNDGHISLSVLNNWKPNTPFIEVLVSIYA